MLELLKRLRWGLLPMSLLSGGLGLYLDANQIISWGIPSWVWYALGYGLITLFFVPVIIGLWRENKILRIPHEEQKELRLLDEKIKLREPYSDRIIIPEKLFKMSEIAKDLAARNPLELVTQDFDESMAEDFKEIMEIKVEKIKRVKISKADMFKILKSGFPGLKRYKDPIQQVRALAIALYQVLSSHGEGLMPLLEEEVEYQQMNTEVEKLLIGLPQSIHIKKDAHIQLANAYYTIVSIDISKIDQPALVRLSQPFLKTGIESELSNIRADISSAIEKFLVGVDV